MVHPAKGGGPRHGTTVILPILSGQKPPVDEACRLIEPGCKSRHGLWHAVHSHFSLGYRVGRPCDLYSANLFVRTIDFPHLYSPPFSYWFIIGAGFTNGLATRRFRAQYSRDTIGGAALTKGRFATTVPSANVKRSEDAITVYGISSVPFGTFTVTALFLGHLYTTRQSRHLF